MRGRVRSAGSTHPAEWLSFVLEDSQVCAVVTHSSTRGKVPSTVADIVVVDPNGSSSDGEFSHGPQLPESVNDIAYVLYTWVTGKPKGVEGTQRACLNRLAWMWRECPFQAGEMCCQKTNVGFVDSVWEIFGPLLAGVPSVIVPQETLHDPELLLQSLAHEQVTRMVVVPSLLRMLLEDRRG